jgi:hypothetical protein
VFTEATIDDSMFGLLDGCINMLREMAKKQSVDLGDDDIELVVQLAQTEAGDTQMSCCYYFIDHNARTLFWLHDHQQTTDVDIFSGLRGVADPSHIRALCGTCDYAADMNQSLGHSLESEYWFVILNLVRFILPIYCETRSDSNEVSEPMTIIMCNEQDALRMLPKAPDE